MSPTQLMVSVSERLIKVLPPAFLLLVVMNCVFLAVLTYVFSHNTEVRNEMLTKIIDECLVREAPMTLIVIILIVLLLCGGGGYAGYRGGYYGNQGIGIIGVILVILVVMLFLFGQGRYF